VVYFAPIDNSAFTKGDDMSLINKSAIKEFLTPSKIRIGDDFYVVLDEMVMELIRKAIKRSQENDRNTLKAKDL